MPSSQSAVKLGDIADPENTKQGSRRLSIACVISSLRGGGAELVMTRLTAAMADRGHRVELITFAGPETDFYQVPATVRRRSLFCEAESGSLARRAWNTAKRVRLLERALREIGPDCIVSFTDVMNVLTLLANLRLRMPVVVSERTDPGRHPLDRVTVGLRSALYGSADALVVQNREVLAWARQLRRQPPTRVIPNAIVPFVAGEHEDIEAQNFAPYVLAVGRLVPPKGFDLLIRAFALVRERHPGIRLVILGDGPLRSQLEGLVESLRLEGAVTMPGRRAAGPWLASARVFVLSSRYEGFPNALGEALSAGLPVVATRCSSGPEEMLVDGESGLLVDVGDVDALSRAIVQLLDDPERARRFGRAATQRVSELFGEANIWDEWEGVIGEAIAVRKGAHWRACT